MRFKDAPVIIIADPDALMRVFINLTSNSLKYSRDQLILSLEAEGDQVVITYRNPQSGLSVNEAERLFERYYQKQNTGSAYSSGLGMTVTKLLVERMGGTISARAINGCLDIVILFRKKSK